MAETVSIKVDKVEGCDTWFWTFYDSEGQILFSPPEYFNFRDDAVVRAVKRLREISEFLVLYADDRALVRSRLDRAIERIQERLSNG